MDFVSVDKLQGYLPAYFHPPKPVSYVLFIMRNLVLLVLFVLCGEGLLAQKRKVVVDSFFNASNRMYRCTLIADLKHLERERNSEEWMPAVLVLNADSMHPQPANIRVRPRGVFRREECNPPQLLVDFSADSLGRFQSMGKLKIVHACLDDDYNNQLLLRELLAYKMYERLTSLSFRTHLIELLLQDSNQKKYSRTRFAFFLEDVDDVANRNGCKELADERFSPERLERADYLRFAVFQFMIANPDWSVSLVRNLKLVKPKGVKNSLAKPIPYDFDFAGLVNASYAAPSENLPIATVRERLYMGPKMTPDELNAILTQFKEMRPLWLADIDSFTQMDARNRRDCKNFIESFFNLIDDKGAVMDIFVKGIMQVP